MTRLVTHFALFCCCIGLAAVEALPQQIGPDDPRIQLIGAWSDDFKAAWTGTGLRFRSDAAAVNLLIEDSAKGGPNKTIGNNNNYLALQIDDQEAQVIELEKGVTRYAIPGLDGQPHTITITKRTEPLFGAIRFAGLEVTADSKLLDPPPRPSQRLQVIGDSISAGYGNGAPDQNAGFTPIEENGWLTYWAIAARALDAEARCAAWSGQGVYRNRENKTTWQMPQMWRFALPYGNGHAERAGDPWVPTWVVINLGTNDTAKGIPTQEEYNGAYRALIADIRNTAPDCHIFCAVGPMMDKKRSAAIAGYLEAVVADTPNCSILRLSNKHGMKGFGGHWHPNIKSHQGMADQLIAAIKALD